MKYMLFSMLACPKCAEIKEYLEKNLKGEEHSLADSDGVLKFRKLYPQVKDKVERNKDGSLPIPTILFVNESNEVVNVANDLDKIKQIVENKPLI